MVPVRTDIHSELPDGKQIADDRLEIQGQEHKRQYAENNPCRGSVTIGRAVEMAGCAGYVRCLHTCIFDL